MGKVRCTNKKRGALQIADLSESAKRVLKIHGEQTSVICDPLEGVIPHKVVRVKINNKEFYIPEPKMMLAYKVVHLGQNFDSVEETDKFVSDFNAMLKGMEAIYSREELLQAAHEIIFTYAPNLPNNTFVSYHNPKFRGEIRKFYDEMLKLDPDVKYLSQLQYGKERSIGVLKILHYYQSPKAKQVIIDFINQHQKQIDQWYIDPISLKNQEVLADFLLSHQNLLENFKSRTGIQGEISREVIIETLETHYWAFDEYGRQIIDKDILEEMRPRSSTLMDILIKINKKNTQQELEDISELIKLGMSEWDLYHLKKILGAKFTVKIETRQKLLAGLKIARATLDDQEFKGFIRLLYTAVVNSSYYGSTLNLIKIKEEEQPDMVVSVFEQFGIEYK